MKKNLRVLVVCEQVSPFMGSERVLSSTIKYLKRAGFEVATIDPRTSSLPPEFANRFDLAHWFNSGSTNSDSLRFLRSLSIPIVTTVTYWPPASEFNAALVYGFDPKELLLALAARIKKDCILAQIASISSKLVFTSPKEQEMFFTFLDSVGFEIDESKTVIVENAVDPEELPLPPYEKQPHKITTVGRIEVAKNQQSVIHAFSYALEDFPDAQYHLFGRDSLNLAQSIKVRNVFFHGEVPPAEVLSALSTSALHVLPSFRDTPGLASLEAAALGCKLVASDEPHGTAHEYFPRKFVSFCNPLSITSIYKSIIRELQRPYSDDLRKFVLEHYSYPVVIRKLVNAYLSLV